MAAGTDPTARPLIETKACTNPDCPHGETAQPLEHFHRRSDSKDGRQSWCRDCVAAKGATRTDAERRKARARAWAKADAVTRERHQRTWRAAFKRALKDEGLKP